MRSHRPAFAIFTVAALLLGCQRGAVQQAAAPPNSEVKSSPPANSAQLIPGEDVLTQVASMNERVPLPTAEFRKGGVEELDTDTIEITKTANGFSIQLPSHSPIPTPTVYRGRLYVSGGFSSSDYYCFDAKTGDVIWAAQLDDDGPSSAVPYDDSIIFACESCTIFALAADTGQMRWSHWLGDPLLSSPIVAGDRVVITYPGAEEDVLPTNDDATEIKTEDPFAKKDQAAPDEASSSRATPANAGDIKPTHIVACFDAKTGELVWRRWLDSDCMSAPIAVNGELYVTSLTGIVYRFDLQEGRLDRASRLRATSAPVIVGNQLFVTRRADEQDKQVAECITMFDRASYTPRFATAHRVAPYLDQIVQQKAAFSGGAGGFESQNGIGGGFGGGFGGGGIGVGGIGGAGISGGQFSVPERTQQEQPTADTAVVPTPSNGNTATDADSEPVDLLASTQLAAAANIGLGNVSTLQSFQGSRILHWNNHLYNCMGDRIICTSAASGDVMWSIPLSGDLAEAGGHLAAPPVAAGRFLFVATLDGEILQIEPKSGRLEARHKVGAPIRSSPIIHQGRIYVGTQEGKVVCIDTGNPELTGWPMRGKDAAHTNVVNAD